MKKKIENCNPTIEGNDTLMTDDGIFVYMEIYKENCLKTCKMKGTCGIVISLLDRGDYKKALQTLKNGKL